VTYARGHIPDHPAVVAARPGLHQHREYGAMRAGTMPLATNNRALILWLLNQFDVGGCEGCAHAIGVALQLALDGTPLAEPPSHIGFYLGALMCDAELNLDGTLPRLIDTGTMPSSITSGMLIYGGSAASVWGQLPMSSRTMYDPTPGLDQGTLIQPSPNQLYAERFFRLQGAYFLQSVGAARARDIIRVLASKRVLTIAIPASGQDFQGYRGGVLSALSGPIDHAQLIVDYTWLGDQASLDSFMNGDDTLLSLLQVHGINSWGGVGCPDGGDWGEVDTLNKLGGQYRANSNFVQQAEDWCVLDLKRVA
jgi:hypothetical protein